MKGDRQRVTERALRLLEARPYTRAALGDRLRRPGRPGGAAVPPSPETIEAVLADLERAGLLDDRAYAAGFAERSLASRPESESRLIQRLRARGVPPELARQAAREAHAGEAPLDMARRALDRAWRRYAGLPPDLARQRAGSFLMRRGFPPDVARAAVLERLGAT